MSRHLPPSHRRHLHRRQRPVAFAALCAAAFLLCSLLPAHAQQQFAGLCARAKIVILQELTLERIGFEATLEVTNNDGEEPITDFSAELTFVDPARATNGVPFDASSLFFVRAPTLENITGASGNGTIAPTKTAVIRWFIIPKISAGGITPNGIRYLVGANLSARFKNVELPADVLQVFPDNIYVKPEPQLEITYFQPRDVQGDDPFTEIVESPIPFTLGVLVKNSGHGIARKIKINSQQPQIVENLTSLLLVAQLLGARVMDAPRQPNLIVDLGDLNPGETRKGAWDMITSLSGEFTEFKASYTHASELGGEETSVIKSLQAHFIAREVLNDQPGRDAIKDFLADTDRDEAMIPDALYESQGNVLPVNHLLNATIQGGPNPFEVHLVADRNGWGYIRLDDPGQARLQIQSVIRSDGKVINTNNVWTNVRYEPGTNRRLSYLNILDLVELGNYTYTVTEVPSAIDTTPPTTTLHFAGTATQSTGNHYITPETQLYFLSEDDSPVSIVYSLTNGPFVPALPFFIRSPGTYDLRFFATDSSGNRESTNFASIIVFDDPPSLDNLALTDPSILVAGDALSLRPALARLSFDVLPNPTAVDAQIEVFRGVLSWARVSGTPSSPTRDTAATLTVSGDHLDFYRYRLNGGPWSGDRTALTPIEFTSLAAGAHQVEVLGRSRYGSYPPETNAVRVAWTVNPNAPATRVTGTPPTPTSARTATLLVDGPAVTDYRWTINNGFYRAETPVTNALQLSALTGTQQVVSVIGKTNGVFQATNNPTTVAWTIDPAYGGDFSRLQRVRSVTQTNVAATTVNFSWDGRNDSGVPQAPGYYLVKVTLRDQLGRFSFSTRLVRIAELASNQAVLVDAARGPRRSHARGPWAVWQDQGEGTFQVYALNLLDPAATPTALTAAPLNQENPHTDGRYAVWQGRQPNGNWDVFLQELGSASAPQPLSDTADQDEINPAIDWPWVVCQTRPTSDPAAPWRIHAFNLRTGQRNEVWPGPLEQLDPDVEAGRVVWQDHRDVGFGEIYYADLETGERRRLTTNTFGQYFPAISGPWVVWQDNRNGNVDIYGYHLLRQAEVQLTSTPENEAHPYLDGPWLLCEEDSLDISGSNIRLLHLSSLRAVPLTRSFSLKSRPAFASGRIVWEDRASNASRILNAEVPAVQAVFQNQNAIPITTTMASRHQNAFNLLRLWREQAGVEEISTYTALVPAVTQLTARWQNGAPTGNNFTLSPNGFLWVRFNRHDVLDLGLNDAGPIQLETGVNALSYTAFPSGFTAFKLLRQLGLDHARAVRMLDAESGRWVAVQVDNGVLQGENFTIPHSAVLLIDMAAPVNLTRFQ